MVKHHKPLFYVALAAILALAANAAMAGVTGAEFLPAYTLLTGWIDGYLGRTLAVGAMILGIGTAAFAQRPLLGLSGLFIGMVVLILPAVLNAMLGAVI